MAAMWKAALRFAREPATRDWTLPSVDHVVFRSAKWMPQTKPHKALAWRAVTDAAFGGKSTCRVENDGSSVVGEIAQEGGFAAVQATLTSVDGYVGDHAGVSVSVRTDGRKYAFNVTPESLVPDDLYQAFIALPNAIPPPGALGKELEEGFSELELGWERFLLSGRGFVREEQRAFDTERLVRVGFAVGGRGAPPGPFRLDIAEIKWLAEVAPESR